MRNRKSDIEKYLRGELSPAEMHALEKEALNDPFLAEALEGVEQAGADNFLYDLHRINRSVHDRSRRRKAKNKKTIQMWGWTTAIAATVLLIAISGFLVINMLRGQAAREQATQELALLQGDESEKDTVVIPLPTEKLVLASEEKNAPSPKEDRAYARSGIASTQRALSQADRGAEVVESKVQPAEAEASDDKRISRQEELLALNEAIREGETKAKEEAARKLDSPPVEQPQTRAAAIPEEDHAGDRSKKSEERVAGVQAQTRAPSLSAPLARDSMLLKGKVVSIAGEELPGVNVIIKGTNRGTVTDVNGYFQLAIPSGQSRILFLFIGFTPREVEVKDQGELNVQMEEDVTSLSEVVVTGYGSGGAGTPAPGTFSFAEPDGGRTDFKDYLNRAVQYPQEAILHKAEGRVTVRFTVDPTGQLTDFEVVRGIGFGCEEELIRVIRLGPSWTPSKQGDHAIPDKVRVRYRFELPR